VQVGNSAITDFTGCYTEFIVNCVLDEYIVKDTRKKWQISLEHVFNLKLLMPRFRKRGLLLLLNSMLSSVHCDY
jgi:hypothetical protein